MDTRSKSNDENLAKNHNKVSRKVCVLMVAVLFFLLAGFFSISNVCFMNDNIYTSQMDYINDNAIRYVKNLNRFYLYFKNFEPKIAYDKIKELEKAISDKTITSDEIERTNGNVMEEDIISYTNDGETEILKETEEISLEAEDLYFEKAPESYYSDIDIEEMKKNGEAKEIFIIKYKELKSVYENYEQVRNYLKNNKSFQYRIEDKYNDETVYTNNDNIENEAYYYKFYLDDTIFNSIKFNGEFLSTSFEQNNLEGYIIIPKNVEYSDRFRTNGEDYLTAHSILKEAERQEVILSYFNYIIPILFFIAFILIIYIMVKEKEEVRFILERLYSKYRKIPVCVKIILMILAFRFFDSYLYSIIGVMPAGSAYYNVLGAFVWEKYKMTPVILWFDLIMFLFLAIFFAMVCILSIIFIIDMIRKPSKFKDEFEIKFIQDAAHDTKYIFYTQSYGLFILYLFLLIGTIGSLILFSMVFMSYALNHFYIFVMIALEVVGLITVYEIIKLILAHCKLSYCIENMAEGNENIVSENSKAFKKPFENLKIINNDINKKIEEMMKNERLKTELITNVSHDLKTPLTSIINYIDLLKEERIDNNSASEYIEILDGKSQRLKTLIDDLFEASKLSSNQFKLDVSKSDVVALLKQTLGELNNKIEESNINFIIELPNNSIFLDIDGQQIWRVFDNLLNNILKYSPEKSRAYISLEETETEVKIIMKNISKAPLNFDADELFERFKRGDKSRTTEGSGLGLSIAKSIVELHNGNIFINIDGDLFKVIVLLKK